MGVISGMTESRASIEDPRVSISDPGVLAVLFGDTFKSATGIQVTTERALGVPAIWAAVNFISNTIASLPLQLFKTSGGERTVAKTDPIYSILHDVVNDDKLTSFKWRKAAMTAVLTGGRSFTYIERNRAMRPKNFWPLDPKTVTVQKKDFRTSYVVSDGGKKKEYPAGDVIDIPFMSMGEISHRSPFSTMKNAIGLAIAMEEYASRFFQNGGVPPLAMHGPATSASAVGRAKSAIDDAIRQANEQDKNILYLPTGHELKPLAFNPEQGQLTEARLFQLQEIARIYSMPPMFLQDLSNGTFSNTEQQDLHFVKHTLTHWLELWEQELNAKLFTGSSRFAEFNVDGLLRGDFKSRMEGAAQGVQNALRTPNELRAKDNLPSLPGGDDLYIQGATVPLIKPDGDPAE